jgi:hypothetical protein
MDILVRTMVGYVQYLKVSVLKTLLIFFEEDIRKHLLTSSACLHVLYFTHQYKHKQIEY